MNQIKHRYTGAVLYEYDSGMTLRDALSKTTKNVNLKGADLHEADLRGAALREADLREADLRDADLREADLRGADLRGADLSEADLSEADLYMVDLQGADLQSADLRWADLQGAELYEAYIQGTDLYGVKLYGANLGKHGKLVGLRPFFQCGPIGSRSDYLLSFITDKGIVIKAGCFTGTLDEFRTAVEKPRGKSDHGNEYAMAMRMVEAHASLWMPKEATK